MVWLTLGISALMLLGAVLAVQMVTKSERMVRVILQEQLVELRKDHQSQRNSWEAERERLLNRAMTKEWESYAQMSAAMVASSPSDLPPEGMSDETESKQWEARMGALGLGETFVEVPGFDADDVRGLGLG